MMFFLPFSICFLISASIVQSKGNSTSWWPWSASSSTPTEKTQVPEELPQPEELRYPHKGIRGSYNPYEAYESLDSVRKNPPSSRVAFDLPKPSRKDYFLDDEFQRKSGSGYDSYPSESGYGHKCDSVNASAIALLALLFLLNLVQDIIEQVTAGNTRKKRDIGEEEPASLQFIYDGGLDALREGLPEIVIPLMVKLSDARTPECVLRPMCDANTDLASKYGPLGRVFATLTSNVISGAFFNGDPRSVNLVKKAAFHGRNENSCLIYEHCMD